MKTQFVTDDHGKKLAVILPIDEYNRLMEDLDELEDIRKFDASQNSNREFIDAEQAFEEIERERKLNQR